MTLLRHECIYQGKAKSLYATDNPRLLIAEFRDDMTAFDGEKKQTLANKGEVNNQINAHIMKALKKAGIPVDHVDAVSPTESIVKRLTMIPLECVIRNIAAGSLCRRLGIEAGRHLTPAVYELFLKDDDLHDPFINEDHAIHFNWATVQQLEEMKRLSLEINQILSALLSTVGLILVDAKFEFGLDADGHITLGDEISPDSCRIWDAETRESLDKDRFRQDLGNVIGAYQIIAGRLGI